MEAVIVMCGHNRQAEKQIKMGLASGPPPPSDLEPQAHLRCQTSSLRPTSQSTVAGLTLTTHPNLHLIRR